MQLRTALQKQRLSFHRSNPIAHRGNCGSYPVPENTLAAVVATWQRGAKWVECDVNLAADGELIVLHDDTLRRTTNAQGVIADTSVAKLTYAEIAAFDAGCKTAPAFTGEKIPTFRQFLALIKKLNMSLVLELKPSIGQELSVAQKTMQVLQEFDFINDPRLLVQSFIVECLREARRLQPTLNLGLLIEEWAVYTRMGNGVMIYPEAGISICKESVEDVLRELECTALVAYHAVLTKERIDNVKINSQTPFVLTWTLDDRARADELFRAGVDAVITDYPERYLTPGAENTASFFAPDVRGDPHDSKLKYQSLGFLPGSGLK